MKTPQQTGTPHGRGQGTLPLVSIFTITYNSEEFLEETIKSVISQDYANIEYIIVDGGSTDGTLDIIRKYEDRIAKWVSEPDDGISDAINKGILMCTGDVVGQIFSDDWYADQSVIGRVAEVFRKSPEVKALYGIQDYIDRDTGKVMFKWGRDSDPSEIMKRSYIPYPTLFVSRDVYKAIGLFRTDHQVAMDYELMIRLVKHTKPYFLNYTIACMRAMGVSGMQYVTSFKETQRALWENGHYFAAIMMGIRNTAKFILIKLGMSDVLFRLWAGNVSPKAEGPR